MRHFEASAQTVSGNGMRVAVVASRYNGVITEALVEGAVKALRETGVAEGDITVVRVPGAFEIPLALLTVLEVGEYDCGVALGCVIRGDTPHFEYVASGCTTGLMDVSLSSRTPVGFGILTTETQAQAEERCRPDETNKGREAALAALELAATLSNLEG